MFSYRQKVQARLSEFVTVEVRKIPREQNAKANALSKLAVANEDQRVRVMFEDRATPSVPRQLVGTITTMDDADWQKPILEYLQSGLKTRYHQEKG